MDEDGKADGWSTAWPEGQGRETLDRMFPRMSLCRHANSCLHRRSSRRPTYVHYSVCTVHVCSGLPAGIPIRLFEFDVYLLHAQSATLVPDPADAREGQD